MNRFQKGCLALVLVMSTLSGTALPLPIMSCVSSVASAAEIRRPVIIVDEPSFEVLGNGVPESALASHSDSAGTLAQYLVSRGYVHGKNLFEVTISGVRDLPDGALQLAATVRRAMRLAVVSESDASCDIVATGLSGLIARYALENGYIKELSVANLVMASAPNRGTFLADVVKSVLEIVRQESILEKETRGPRFVPSIRDILGTEDIGFTESVKALTEAKALRAPDWEDEASWISSRSAALWEPLYGEYVKGRYFAIPYAPTQSPKETFAGWVRRTFPDVWKRLITEAEWPASSEQPLSLPYYEYLAVEVARNQYVMRTASDGSLVDSLFSEAYVPTGWKDAAIHYGMKILRHYAEKALVTLKAEAQKFVAEKAVRFTGLGNGPDSPFIDGLIKEDLLINLGTSSSKRFERIPANLSLKAMNNSSQAAARTRKTRYVSVCSRLANPWGLIWPQLAPNDSLLEVDSSVPPVGTGDLVAVFGGFLRLPGKSVLDDRKAQDYIADILSEEVSDHCAGLAAESPAQASLLAIDASSWEPKWCDIGASTKVTVGVTALPEGWQCQVWEERPDPETGEYGREQGLMWAFDYGGNYVLRLSPGADRLGVRLCRSGPANPVFGNAVGSAFAQESEVRVFIALAEDDVPGPIAPPDAGEPEEGGAGDGEGAGGGNDSGCDSGDGDSGSEAADTDNETGGSGTGSGGKPVPDAPLDNFPEDLPTVRVVYRSKHTTLWKPKETVHSYWLLDFGDGHETRIDGSPFLAADHAYSVPGEYKVIAVSYDNDNQLLYTKEWLVNTALAGETRRFECDGIAPLKVDIALNGPEKWVTGKMAVFSVGANVDTPPNAEIVSVKCDPGETFGVIWERAGDFVVGCAASIIVKYSLEDAEVEVKNIYVREVPVTVLTTGVTQ